MRLSVYDALGRIVAVPVDGMRSAGDHEVIFEAGRLPAGMYLYRLEASGASLTGVMHRVD